MLYNWMHFRSLNPPRDYTAATRESIQHLLDQWLILTWKERAAWLNGLLLWQLISQLLQWPTPDVSPGPNPLVMYISTNPLSCCDTQILSWWSSAQLRCLESWPHVLLSSPVARHWQECVSWTYLWSALFSSHFSICRLLLVLVTVLLGFCTKSEPCTAPGNKKLKLQDICIL